MFVGTSLAVQWLRLHTPSAEGTGSIPGQGTKILHAVWHGQKKKKVCNLVFCNIQLKDSFNLLRNNL